ncbi:MAG: 50S ribosomal protein L15 [Phycisphaerales bacterium JB040]
MMIHEITAQAGKYKDRKRVGRGPGSGHGKRSGRGQKGAGARSGNSRKYQFEGGQMPFFRRMPKFGFTNANFKTSFFIVNLRDLVQSEAFSKGGAVNADSLIAAGLVRDTSRDIKILGSLPEGQDKLTVKLQVEVNRVTDNARRLITEAGGSVTEIGTRRDQVRGVDRNSEDRTPKNLTKKLKKRQWHAKRSEAFAKGEVLKKG